MLNCAISTSCDHYRYTAYGLEIESALALPELVCSVLPERPLDVTIEIDVAPPVPESAESIGFDQWRCGDRIWLQYDAVARIFVQGGRRIVVEPSSGVDPRIVRLALLGNAIGMLLHQRGLLLLHAGAIVIDGKAAAFAGFSGAGKSTMTGALVARGHTMIADDVVAIDITDADHPYVYFWFSTAQTLS